jgi:hypothetical protein
MIPGSERSPEVYEITVRRLIRVSPKAVLLDTVEHPKPVWIPKSVMVERDRDSLLILHWWAKASGLDAEG